MRFDELLERLGVDAWKARSRLKLEWAKWGWRVGRGVACTLAGCTYGLVLISPIGDHTEAAMRRVWYALRGERALVAPVMMVRVDDAAYARVNKASGEPFPRDVIADGILRIADGGARMILLDMIFRRETTPDVDKRLREALAATPSVIGRGLLLQEETGPDGKQRMNRIRLEPRRMYRESAKAVMSLKVAAGNGVVENISLGPTEGVVGTSRVPLVEPIRDIVAPDIKEPGWRDLVNYYGEPFTIPSVGLAEILDSDAESLARHFKGKVVFVGVTTTLSTGLSSLNDTFAVPVSRSRMFGVEIHATIAANLLEGSWLRRLRPEVEMMFGVTLAFVAAYITLSLRPNRGLPLVAIIGAGWLTCSYAAFSWYCYFLPAATLVCLVCPAIVALRLGLPAMRERSRRRYESGPGDT